MTNVIEGGTRECYCHSVMFTLCRYGTLRVSQDRKCMQQHLSGVQSCQHPGRDDNSFNCIVILFICYESRWLLIIL